MISGINHHLLIFMLVFRVHYVVCGHKPSSLTANFQTFLTGNTRIPVAFLQLWADPE